jgi:hypothetical protein
MARHSQDREDLLRDAKALVPRIMLRTTILDKTCDVFAGFRSDSLSMYFDSDPAYHFNSRGELRRAFVNDQIIKAVKGKLFIWEPVRKPDEVTMRSQLMTVEEMVDFSENWKRRFNALNKALDERTFDLVGQFPEDVDAMRKLQSWLRKCREIKVARVASVG